MKDIHIMPFRITVAIGTSFKLNNPKAYNSVGTPIYNLVKKHDSKRFIDFTEDLYMELLSIQDTQNAIDFIKAYNPQLQFLYYQPSNPSRLEIGEEETLDRLGDIVATAIKNFFLIKDFVSKHQEYRRLLEEQRNDETPEQKEDLLRNEDTCRTEMVSIYKELFRLLGRKSRSYTTYEQMYNFYYEIHDKVDEVIEQVYEEREEWETFEECYNTLVEQYFDGNEALRVEHYKQVAKTTKSIVDNIMFEDVSSYIDGILKHVEIVFDAPEMSFACNCPDLLSAMYMMMYVSLHEGKTYRMCAHKNCRQYYLVNKSHPQSRCPTHMKARQNKRQKLRIYPDDSYYDHHVK